MKKLFRFVTLAEASTYKMHPRNRAIDRKHLQKIKKQMRDSFDTMPPITVNINTLHIIDGQHRLKAFMDLCEEGVFAPGTLLAVMLVDIPAENELNAIIEANINNRGWTPTDYIHSHIKNHNQNYISLDDWARSHVLTANQADPTKPKYRRAAVLIKGSTLRYELPNGSFTVTDDELKKGDTIHNEIIKICQLMGLPLSGQWMEQMILSWFKNRALHPFKEWTSYIRTHTGGLRKYPKATLSDWDALFAKIHSELDLKKMTA